MSLNVFAPLNDSVGILSRFFSISLIGPISFNKETAVLSPQPAIPGMLSEESPFKAKKSMIRDGFTPNFSTTPVSS